MCIAWMSWALAIVGYCKMHYSLGYAIVNNGFGYEHDIWVTWHFFITIAQMTDVPIGYNIWVTWYFFITIAKWPHVTIGCSTLVDICKHEGSF